MTEKIDLNLGEYQQDEYEGEIVSVVIMKLKDWLKKKANPLDAEQVSKWHKYDAKAKKAGKPIGLDRDNICVTIQSGNRILTTQFQLPEDAGGYQRTNLKKFKDINGLPDHVADWGGKTVKLKLGSQGFLDVAL